jgi:hypothetical protein
MLSFSSAVVGAALRRLCRKALQQITPETNPLLETLRRVSSQPALFS